MKTLRAHIWSTLSIAITVTTAVAVFALSRVFANQGIRLHIDAVGQSLGFAGTVAVLVSLALAIIGLSRERNRSVALVAIVLSVVSAVLYIQ